MLGNFHAFVVFKLKFSKNSFSNPIGVSNGLDHIRTNTLLAKLFVYVICRRQKLTNSKERVNTMGWCVIFNCVIYWLISLMLVWFDTVMF